MDKFLSSIYVNDLVSGSSDLKVHVRALLEVKAPTHHCRIQVTEVHHKLRGITPVNPGGRTISSWWGTGERAHAGEDQSYAKSSLGVRTEEKQGINKFQGIQWDVAKDQFQLDIRDVVHATEESEPTKRNVVSISVRFFDPLGIISPVTILFKVFCQELCEAKLSWDEPLTGPHLDTWNQLLTMLRDAKTITIPWGLYDSVHRPFKSARIIGFCNASSRAYAAVIYMRLESESCINVKFITAKTRVTPVGGMTIPRLELLSALLLSKLITTVTTKLEREVSLNDPACFSDSKASLFWIKGTNH